MLTFIMDVQYWLRIQYSSAGHHQAYALREMNILFGVLSGTRLGFRLTSLQMDSCLIHCVFIDLVQSNSIRFFEIGL